MWSREGVFLLSCSINFLIFVRPDGSLPRLQKPAIGPYPSPDESSPHALASYFFKVQFNIILESKAGCSKWSVCFMLLD